MFKEIIQNIATSEMYGTISFLVFFIMFLFLLYRTFRLNKAYSQQMSELPLDDSTIHEPKNQDYNENS